MENAGHKDLSGNVDRRIDRQPQKAPRQQGDFHHLVAVQDHFHSCLGGMAGRGEGRDRTGQVAHEHRHENDPDDPSAERLGNVPVGQLQKMQVSKDEEEENHGPGAPGDVMEQLGPAVFVPGVHLLFGRQTLILFHLFRPPTVDAVLDGFVKDVFGVDGLTVLRWRGRIVVGESVFVIV